MPWKHDLDCAISHRYIKYIEDFNHKNVKRKKYDKNVKKLGVI